MTQHLDLSFKKLDNGKIRSKTKINFINLTFRVNSEKN